MAERRMFSKTIFDSDAFLDKPVTAQLLYFHLAMRADDDGFINKPKTIMRMCCCKDDDMKLLIEKKFVIPFETGIVVIGHWKIHNYIRRDTYTETKYKSEKSQLSLDENAAYSICCDESVTMPSRSCIELVEDSSTQVRLGKDRLELGKDRLDILADKPPAQKRKSFTPPSVDDVKAYCTERNNGIDAERFVDYYTANGWKVGKNQMKDWKAAVRTWERNAVKKQEQNIEGSATSGKGSRFYEGII